MHVNILTVSLINLFNKKLKDIMFPKFNLLQRIQLHILIDFSCNIFVLLSEIFKVVSF